MPNPAENQNAEGATYTCGRYPGDNRSIIMFMAVQPQTPTSSNTGQIVSKVLDFEAALAEVLRHAFELRATRGTTATEDVPILESVGFILAQPILADRDQPPFDRSTRDGFAVRAEEFSSGGWLRVVGQVRAGDLWTGEPLAKGEAIEIMTGAPLPAGADSVAMLEFVELSPMGSDSIVQVQTTPGRLLRWGENVVPQGSEARACDEVVAAGSRMTAAEIALAATAGLPTLAVYKKPAVAIVATGDELVELHQQPDARQIRNSNSYALAALIQSAGAEPYRLAIARDVREELLERITQARQHDLILFSGGVSMGKFDLVEEVLAELGAEFFFTGVRMQPGKPVVFGRLPPRNDAPARYFFGLPGNPISTQVTFHCFVEPFLQAIAGGNDPGPKFVQATLAHDVEAKPGLTRLLPARLISDFSQPSINLVRWQGSGDLAANARANCYAVFTPGDKPFRIGEVISVLLR